MRRPVSVRRISKEADMKKLAVPMLVLLLVAAASAQTWFPGTVEQAVARAKSENKLVLLDFYSGG
jgi:hypothetical protein